MKVLNQEQGKDWILYNGDSCEILRGIPSNSLHYSIFSPPFASLYTYSNSDRDLGNCKRNNEFYDHFTFIVQELCRVIMPGRLISIHCMDIPAMKERDGFIGLKDFPAELRKLFETMGFIYHSKVTIWKDPLIEATRTHAIGLMHKQIIKDSSMCRQGLPDYLLTMRKTGSNPEPVEHPQGFAQFIGEGEPSALKRTPLLKPGDSRKNRSLSMTHTDPVYSHHVWRRYASPVWMDINQSNTLNRESAREEDDEKHICPLQLDVIGRALEIWTNLGDRVLSPFAGIGSEGYQALKMGRKFVGIELKGSYYTQAVANLKRAEMESQNQGLFAEVTS